MLTIYLAGSAQQIKFRTYIYKFYGHNKEFEILDPLKLVDQNSPDIVIQDKNLINESDIIIAYIQKWTCGTIMEIMYSFMKGKKIYVITTNEKIRNDVWLKEHTHEFFRKIYECFEYIHRTHINKERDL